MRAKKMKKVAAQRECLKMKANVCKVESREMVTRVGMSARAFIYCPEIDNGEVISTYTGEYIVDFYGDEDTEFYVYKAPKGDTIQKIFAEHLYHNHAWAEVISTFPEYLASFRLYREVYDYVHTPTANVGVSRIWEDKSEIYPPDRDDNLIMAYWVHDSDYAPMTFWCPEAARDYIRMYGDPTVHTVVQVEGDNNES